MGSQSDRLGARSDCLADQARHAVQAGPAGYPDQAGNADHDLQAGSTIWAGHPHCTVHARHADTTCTADPASTADPAGHAGHAGNSDWAFYAEHAGVVNDAIPLDSVVTGVQCGGLRRYRVEGSR